MKLEKKIYKRFQWTVRTYTIPSALKSNSGLQSWLFLSPSSSYSIHIYNCILYVYCIYKIKLPPAVLKVAVFEKLSSPNTWYSVQTRYSEWSNKYLSSTPNMHLALMLFISFFSFFLSLSMNTLLVITSSGNISLFRPFRDWKLSLQPMQFFNLFDSFSEVRRKNTFDHWRLL